MVSPKLTPLFLATAEKRVKSSYFLNVTKYAVQHVLTKIMFELKCKVNEVVTKIRSKKAGSLYLHSFFFIRIYFIRISRLKFAKF